MFAKQGRAQGNTQHDSKTTEPPPSNGQQLECGGANAFYWYQIFTLDSVVVKTQTLLSSRGGFLTTAM